MKPENIPTLLDSLKAMCAKTGLGFRYRKTGSLKALKPCGGQCVLRVTCGGSVVITGIDAVGTNVWDPIATEGFRVGGGGWIYYR